MNAWRITLCLFLSLIAQSSLLPLVELPVERPDLALLITLYVALVSEPEKGTLIGFWAGVFQDACSAEPPGLHCFAKSLIGYLAPAFRNSWLVNAFVFQALMVALLTAVHGVILYWVGGALRPHLFDGSGLAYLTGNLPQQVGSNVLFWILLHPLLRRMLPQEE